ncbi:MAG: phosphoribosylformylglycinamidine cyclo-ligase [Deltaproteobacteria bacterium]
MSPSTPLRVKGVIIPEWLWTKNRRLVFFPPVPKKTTYKSAGVDVDAGNRFVELIKPLAKSTYTENVVGKIGGFAGLCALPLSRYKNPILVSSTDGVGTKLKLAFMTGKLDTVGIDLVAMNVNDVVTCGAEPLFFLDYFATSRLNPEEGAEVIKGIAEGCRQAGCALLGGETAEMPGFYKRGEFDLAGFVVGIVDRDEIIDGSKVAPGDTFIGIASSGLHSNGYSLARKVIFAGLGLKPSDTPPALSRSVGESLLEPTKIYVKTVLSLIKSHEIKALAHITGGGLIDNIPRVIPETCSAHLDSSLWEMPEIMKLIRDSGRIEPREMHRTFNCGVGMVLVVSQGDEGGVLDALKKLGEKAWVIGEVKAAADKSERVLIR